MKEEILIESHTDIEFMYEAMVRSMNKDCEVYPMPVIDENNNISILFVKDNDNQH